LGCWTVLEPNRPVFAVQTRIAGGLPGPVAINTGVSARQPSVILFVSVAAPPAFMVRPVSSLLLFFPATLVTSIIFTPFLLNAMWFPQQLGHCSCVWPNRAPCFELHTRTLQLWSMLRWGSEQYQHAGLLLNMLPMLPHPQKFSDLLSGPPFMAC